MKMKLLLALLLATVCSTAHATCAAIGPFHLTAIYPNTPSLPIPAISGCVINITGIDISIASASATTYLATQAYLYNQSTCGPPNLAMWGTSLAVNPAVGQPSDKYVTPATFSILGPVGAGLCFGIINTTTVFSSINVVGKYQ